MAVFSGGLSLFDHELDNRPSSSTLPFHRVVFFCGDQRLVVQSFVLDGGVRGQQAVEEAMAQVRF